MFATVESKDPFNKYFNQVVQVSQDEKKQVVSNVVENVKILLRGCHDQDKNVMKEPKCVGSSWQGLKTKDPYEYDLNVYFGMRDLNWGSGSLQEATFRLQDQESTTKDVLWDDKPLKKSLKGYVLIETDKPLPSPPPGHLSIGASEDDNKKFIFQGHIVPFLVKSYFRELLEKSLGDNKTKLRG